MGNRLRIKILFALILLSFAGRILSQISEFSLIKISNKTNKNLIVNRVKNPQEQNGETEAFLRIPKNSEIIKKIAVPLTLVLADGNVKYQAKLEIIDPLDQSYKLSLEISSNERTSSLLEHVRFIANVSLRSYVYEPASNHYRAERVIDSWVVEESLREKDKADTRIQLSLEDGSQGKLDSSQFDATSVIKQTIV